MAVCSNFIYFILIGIFVAGTKHALILCCVLAWTGLAWQLGTSRGFRRQAGSLINLLSLNVILNAFLILQNQFFV